MATLRTSASSIFGTIASTAGTLTTTMETATKAVDMLASFVDTAAHKQRINHTIELASYANQAVDDYAKEEAQRAVDTAEFKAKSDTHAKSYNEAHEKLMKLLKDKEKAAK